MTHSHSIKLKHQMFTLFDAYITTDFPHFGHKSVAVINKSILNVYHIKQQSPIYYQKWCEFIRSYFVCNSIPKSSPPHFVCVFYLLCRARTHKQTLYEVETMFNNSYISENALSSNAKHGIPSSENPNRTFFKRHFLVKL